MLIWCWLVVCGVGAKCGVWVGVGCCGIGVGDSAVSDSAGLRWSVRVGVGAGTPAVGDGSCPGDKPGFDWQVGGSSVPGIKGSESPVLVVLAVLLGRLEVLGGGLVIVVQGLDPGVSKAPGFGCFVGEVEGWWECQIGILGGVGGEFGVGVNG